MLKNQFHEADWYFVRDMKQILNEPWEQGTRAKWEDTGEFAKTKRSLQVVNYYDLLSDGFPISQLRKIAWKASVDEMCWIYMRQSNNINDLNSSVWNSWSDEEGYIKKAYGYQIAKPTMGHPSQMHYVLHEIKNNPTSRRIMMNMFDAEDQFTKATESLVECAYAIHFSVKDGKLHSTLIQRSGDAIVAAGAGGFNTVGYAFLTHAIAKECGLAVGNFMHVVQDLHIYDRHIPYLEKMLDRFNDEEEIDTAGATRFELPQPQIKIADKPFFELTADDVHIENYFNLGGVGKIPVAV